jgi:hypothetical protein
MFMLYLTVKEFSHQPQLLVKLRLKEVYVLYVFLTATVTHLNFSGVYASVIIFYS